MEINIAIAPDDNYAPYAKTVIKSAIANNSNQVKVWVLDGGLSSESIALLKSAAEFVEFVKIDLSLFKDFPSNGYISVSTWYRFVIAQLLPSDVGSVLYLDCDIAVAGDISELFEIDLSNFAVGAVKDCIWRKFNKRLRLPADFHYFNAGVLLINLDYWRAKNVQGRLFAFLQEDSKRLSLMDQSILNIVLKDEYKELPLEYNVQYLPAFIEESCYTSQEFSKAMRAPKIIHFVNRFKPWSVELGWLNPLNKFFTKYMDNQPEYVSNKASVFARVFLKRFFRKPTMIFRKDYWRNIFLVKK